ncbi:MAG: YgfZ/GcvT domain-containing protein [Gammaproteobacteria bacterium]
MNPAWRTFLDQHALRDAQPETAALTIRAIMTALSEEGLIKIEGADARTFLQGQLSSDIEALTPEQGQFSSWNSPKGRVLTLLRLFLHDGAIYMALPAALTAPILKHLSMYVLRSKVTLSDASDELAGLGLAGDSAPGLLQKAGLPVPATAYQTIPRDQITLMRLHGETPRYACYGSAHQLIALAKQLQLDARWIGNETWSLFRILASEPVIYPQTSNKFVAQMLNLPNLGAISFKKGCYTGQEIIARAQHRGGIKRHLQRAYCAAKTVVSPGTPVHAKENGQAVGEVVDARRDADGIWQMLIVLQDEFDGVPLHISESPITSIG